MRAAIWILLTFSLNAGLFGQKYHYSLRNFKAIDGLPQSQVKALLEDANGYLWVGTEGGGLARFDGRNFKVYTTLDGLQSNIVGFLSLDKKQNLWIVHPRGISKFDGTSFKKFEQPGARTTNVRLGRLVEFQDTIFFMSSPGYIGKIHNDSVYYWSRPMFPRKDGQKEWIINFASQAGIDTVVFCINQRTFFCRTPANDFWVHSTGLFDRILNVFKYKKRLTLLTDKGYWVLNLDTRAFEKVDIPVKHRVVLYDQMRDVFWTSHENGLYKESVSNGSPTVEKVVDDMNFIDILVDSEGNTWLGSDGGGLYKYFIQDFDRCSSENLNYVLAIYHDRYGAIWIGSATKGLFKIHKGKTIRYDVPGDLKRTSVYYIGEAPDGTLYVGGGGGLGKYNRAIDSFEWREFAHGPWKIGVLNVQFDDRGDMYLAMAGGGVNHIVNGTVKNFSVENGLNSNLVMSIHYSKRYQRLFVGDEFGLAEIVDGKVSSVPISGLDNTTVIGIYPYRDSLLLLSTGGSGVVTYNPATRQRKFITRKDGLASDFIYFAAPDEEHVWVGSEKGITRIKLDEHLNVTEQVHFDHDNGLAGMETNQNAFCFFDNNRFFGLVDGVYSYNDYERENTQSFRLHLTAVELFYGEFAPSEYAKGKTGFFNIPVNLSLPPDKNHITFRFNKVDKRNPKSVKFKYFLQGYDKTWSPPSSNTEVTYGNLPPGQYTFLAMSTDYNGTWDDNVLSYPFRINMPFYARTSFMVGMMILLGVLITSILYLRVRQRVRHMVMVERVRISEQERVRKDIARDFHDEMGNQLTRIINYISLLKMNAANGFDRNHHADLYGKVEQSAKYLYTGTRDFIWSIDPSNDELSRLFIHIRDFGEKLFDEKGISFRAVNKVREMVRLPYGFSREANLIFKEAMTNAFKYSQASNITFALHQEGENFIFCLEDDGIGYDRDVLGESGNGLRNMRDRAEKINADLDIKSSPGKGTIVSIVFKNTKRIKHGIAI